MGMNKYTNKQLERYSKINFTKDLNNLTNDVKNKMIANNTNNFDLINFTERLFGMPISLSGSALASTLMIGVLLGTQLQPESSTAHTIIFDLEVFSPMNTNLPSSLLDPR